MYILYAPSVQLFSPVAAILAHDKQLHFVNNVSTHHFSHLCSEATSSYIVDHQIFQTLLEVLSY